MKYTPAWHLNGKPYDVQIEALKRSHGHKRYGYFLEQGLGKTALFLNDFLENYFPDYTTIVMICPNSFKLDWCMAPSEWGVDISTGYWPNDEFRTGTAKRPHLNVINFEAVRSSGYDAVRKIIDKVPCVLCADETSAIKNFKSKTAKAVLDLSKRVDVTRILNGTPLTQNPVDLFSQLKVIGELDKVNPYSFRNHFAQLGGFMGRQVIGAKNEAELHEILNRCSFRALKADWSDLPPKVFVPVRLEMTTKQRKHYKEMLEDLYTLVAGHEYTAPLVLTQLEKLRQIASGLIMDGDKFAIIDPPENNPKIKATFDILESGPGKLIVSYYYRKTGEILLDQFDKAGLEPAFIKGGMKADELIAQKKRFNEDSACRIMVAQITAASRGHTLLGGEGNDRCHRLVYFDQTFSYMDRIQMSDRNHRGVQDQTCTYYDLVLSPIDQAQLNALTKKQDLVTLVVDAVRALRTD